MAKVDTADRLLEFDIARYACMMLEGILADLALFYGRKEWYYPVIGIGIFTVVYYLIVQSWRMPLCWAVVAAGIWFLTLGPWSIIFVYQSYEGREQVLRERRMASPIRMPTTEFTVVAVAILVLISAVVWAFAKVMKTIGAVG